MPSSFATLMKVAMRHKCMGPLEFLDSENINMFVQFLEIFYETILQFLGSLYVTVNVYVSRYLYYLEEYF